MWLKQFRDKGRKTSVVIVIDDQSKDRHLTNSQGWLSKAATTGRHYGLSFIIVGHSYTSMSPVLR